jgi:hypothetical protein
LSVNKAKLYLLAKQAFASKGRLVFPFANKNFQTYNVFEENLTYNEVVCLEVVCQVFFPCFAYISTLLKY